MPTLTDVTVAMRLVRGWVQDSKTRGEDPFAVVLKRRINPGDVYDAYEAIGRRPALDDDVSSADMCGPLTALMLQERPDETVAHWRAFVAEAFDIEYVEAFRAGFRLDLPDAPDNLPAVVLRGLYDGVMAHAAVL